MIKSRLRKKYDYRGNAKRFVGFQAVFYDKRRQPKRKRISLNTKDGTAACQRLAEIERKIAFGQFDPWTDNLHAEGITVGEASRKFLDSRRRHCSEATIETYEVVCRLFRKSLPPAFPLYGVESRHVLDFLYERDLAEATRRGYQDRLRIFFGWCFDEGLCRQNPVPEKKSSKKSRASKLPEFLTEDEFERLVRGIEADAQMKDLSHGNRWLVDAVRFTVSTGLRRGEVCNLRWSAIDTDTGMLRVENTEEFSTKSGRERSVPLVGEAHAIIERLQAEKGKNATPYVFAGATGGKLNGNYLSKRFRFYRRLAKLPENISFHSLRHTFASWFVLRSGDLYRLKEILGHADMKTTLVYAHLRPDALRLEMERTFGNGCKNGSSSEREVKKLRRELEEARAQLKQLSAA